MIAAPAVPGASSSAVRPGLAPEATLAANLLETGSDLRALYESARGSADPAQRHLARRAWSACFPTFLPPAGGRANIDAYTLPLAGAPEGDARAAAYRSLFKRCEGFMSLGADQILAVTQALEDAAARGEATSPGEEALRLLLRGDAINALVQARSAAASGDAYAVASLQEFVYRYTGQLVDRGTLPASERPDLRALGFALAGCQLGLECGPQSLTALRQCAGAGRCSGTVTDRLLQDLASDADRSAALSEARRIVQAIRSGDLPTLGLYAR